MIFYAEIEKPIQKFIPNLESKIAKTILKIKNKIGKLTLHGFKTQYKIMVIKIVLY